MPYNPCGFAVDFHRCAHDEQCRFFSDDDRVDVARFVEVPEGTPAFPGTSLVYCAWNDDPRFPFPAEARGTIRPPFVQFTGTQAPRGLFTGHYCGTLEEHDHGSMVPDAPESVGALGWPLCCHPPFGVSGGGGAGGRGLYTLTPGSFDPGPDCASATTLPLASARNYLNFPSLLHWWWKTPVVAGNTYHLSVGTVSGTGTLQLWTGPCSGLTSHGFISFGGDCLTVTIPAGATELYTDLHFTTGGTNSVFGVRIDPGPC